MKEGKEEEEEEKKKNKEKKGLRIQKCTYCGKRTSDFCASCYIFYFPYIKGCHGCKSCLDEHQNGADADKYKRT